MSASTSCDCCQNMGHQVSGHQARGLSHDFQPRRLHPADAEASKHHPPRLGIEREGVECLRRESLYRVYGEVVLKYEVRGLDLVLIYS